MSYPPAQFFVASATVPALDNIQQSRVFVIASVTSYCPWFDYRGKSPGLLA